MTANSSTPQLMAELVEYHSAVTEHQRRHGFGAQIADALASLIAEDELEREPELTFDDRRRFDFALIGLEFSGSATDLGVAEPGRFAGFLKDAAAYPADPAFLEAAAFVTAGHLEIVKNNIRNGIDLDWNHTWRLVELAAAAEAFDGPLATTGTELLEVTNRLFDNTAAAYLLAESAGLLQTPGERVYMRLHPHRDATPAHLQAHWAQAFAAIDACPDTGAGQSLRADLLDRAGAFLAYGLVDFEDFVEQHPSGRATADASFAGLRTTYGRIMEDLARRSAASDPPFERA